MSSFKSQNIQKQKKRIKGREVKIIKKPEVKIVNDILEHRADNHRSSSDQISICYIEQHTKLQAYLTTNNSPI